jgi:hypothetical protein
MMGLIDETKFVERLDFFDGQRLFASDLQGMDGFNREMRRLHNRSLHQPGVGSGFAVKGKKEDREVVVGPGYAADGLGREIILTENQTIPIPPVAGNQGYPIYFDLTVAYGDDSTLEEAETREGICVDRGVIRRREQPVFCWVELAGEQLAPRKTKLTLDLQRNLRIRLARIQVFNCQLFADVSMAQQLNARPDTTPYISSGTETFESVKATSRQPDLSFPQSPWIISGIVDTTKAEFLTVPDYRAYFVGPREMTLKLGGINTTDVFLVDQFQITDQKRDSFAFLDILIVVGNALKTEDVEYLDSDGTPRKRTRIDEVHVRIKTEWKLAWMGVER